MSQYLVDAIERDAEHRGGVAAAWSRCTATGHLEAVTDPNASRPTTRETRGRPARMFIFIGASPRTDWLDGVVARDDTGFILTGPT